MGRPRFSHTETAQPPRGVPSSLVSTMPVAPAALAELLGLTDGILAGDGIQHQQHFQAGFGTGLFDAAGNFGQLVHQALFVVQAACGIGNDHVVALGRGALDRVKDDGGGVGTLTGLHQRHTGAVGPELQLLAGSGAEGIARGQHHTLALLLVQRGPAWRWWWSCPRR